MSSPFKTRAATRALADAIEETRRVVTAKATPGRTPELAAAHAEASISLTIAMTEETGAGLQVQLAALARLQLADHSPNAEERMVIVAGQAELAAAPPVWPGKSAVFAKAHIDRDGRLFITDPHAEDPRP